MNSNDDNNKTIQDALKITEVVNRHLTEEPDCSCKVCKILEHVFRNED